MNASEERKCPAVRDLPSWGLSLAGFIKALSVWQGCTAFRSQSHVLHQKKGFHNAMRATKQAETRLWTKRKGELYFGLLSWPLYGSLGLRTGSLCAPQSVLRNSVYLTADLRADASVFQCWRDTSWRLCVQPSQKRHKHVHFLDVQFELGIPAPHQWMCHSLQTGGQRECFPF